MTRSRDVADTQDNLGGAVAPFVAGKNRLINGDFRINQRAFSSTTSDAVYMFDRWRTFIFSSSGSATFSAQTFTPGTAPVAGYEAINFMRCVTSGITGNSSYTVLAQLIEDVRTLAGQTVTVSFWAKAGSGTPSVSSEVILNYGSGGSAREPLAASVKKYTISTSWVRYSFSFTMPSLSGKTIGSNSFTELYIWFAGGSDWNSRTDSLGLQNNTFDIWGVQWEAGNVATPFTTASGSIGGELALCQRYFERMSSGGIDGPFGMGVAYLSNLPLIYIQWQVPKRVVPSFAFAGTWELVGGNTFSTMTSPAVSSGAVSVFACQIAGTVSGLTVGDAVILRSGTDAPYIDISAEL